MEKPKIHIASCSFGKDSMATILLALKHGEPLDRVVFSEVMFDRERGISGEIPCHIEWIRGTAIPRLESMGVKVDVVRSQKEDYKWFFTNQLRRGGYYKGKYYGFPIGGACFINNRCKIKPIKDYLKQWSDYDIVQYVGIAIDEPKRLARLDGNKVSLLAKYGYTEMMAFDLCKDCDMLSPLYDTGTRGGCWFCPNAKLDQFIAIRRDHPEMWEELRELSHTPNLCSYGFKYGKTLEEVEREMNAREWVKKNQLNLFD